MFFDDHKHAVTTIIGKRNAKGERTMHPTPLKPEHSRDENFQADVLHLAAEDILGAHHSKSPEALANSLSNFINLHLHAKEGNAPEVPDKEPDRESI